MLGTTLVFYLAGLFAVWKNQWVLGLGDRPVRALTALTGHFNFSSLWSVSGLTSPWPQGHRLITGTLTRLLSPGSDSFTAIHWYQTLSLTAFVAGVLLFAVVAWRIYGVRSAVVAMLLMLGFQVGTSEAASGLTEIYVFFFSSCALAAIIRRDTQNTFLIYLAALANLLASTMRTEIIIISFLQWLFLIGRVRIFHLFAFGFISSFFFLLRLGYSTAIYKGPVTFLDKNKTLFNTNAVQNSEAMSGYLFQSFGWPLAILLGFGLLCLVFRACRKRAMAATAGQRPAFMALRRFAVSPEFFPVRCLIFLLSFMAAGLRSGNLEALPRYWIALMPYICLSGSFLFSGLPLGETRMKSASAKLCMAALAVACFASLISAWQSRTQFDKGELDFINWLRSRPQKGAVFDYMRFRDGRYIVYASPIRKTPRYWGRGSLNPFGIPHVKPTDGDFISNETANDFLLAHKSLLSPECSMLVVPSATYFKDNIEEMPPSNATTPVSYFEKDMTRMNRDGSIRDFKSTVVSDAPPIRLKAIYSTPYVEVFEKEPQSPAK